jgi:hypothetical protein
MGGQRKSLSGKTGLRSGNPCRVLHLIRRLEANSIGVHKHFTPAGEYLGILVVAKVQPGCCATKGGIKRRRPKQARSDPIHRVFGERLAQRVPRRRENADIRMIRGCSQACGIRSSWTLGQGSSGRGKHENPMPPTCLKSPDIELSAVCTRLATRAAR